MPAAARTGPRVGRDHIVVAFVSPSVSALLLLGSANPIAAACYLEQHTGYGKKGTVNKGGEMSPSSHFLCALMPAVLRLRNPKSCRKVGRVRLSSHPGYS